nr:hypothetical protein [Tanacetum cinerariifolium]
MQFRSLVIRVRLVVCSSGDGRDECFVVMVAGRLGVGDGGRFGFVRFIHIKVVDRLVKNLCTLWMGRLRLYANVARFQRPPLNKAQHVKGDNVGYKSSVGVPSNSRVFSVGQSSYVGAVKNNGEYKHVAKMDSKPYLVLDESCILEYDYSLALKGKVSDFGLLTNLKTVLTKEGFENFNLSNLGGFWVLIEFCTKELLEKFKSHVGVGSWFSSLEYASNSFVIDERVVWVDIEGVPIKIWTNNTFNKISSKWGELLFEEDKKNMSLYKDDEDDESDDDTLDNESGGEKNEEDLQAHSVNECNSDAVPDTIFCQSQEESKQTNKTNIEEGEIQSEDPFNIYDLLVKKPNNDNKEEESSKATLKYPRGFTPDDALRSKDVQDVVEEVEVHVLKQKSNVQVNSTKDNSFRGVTHSKEEDKHHIAQATSEVQKIHKQASPKRLRKIRLRSYVIRIRGFFNEVRYKEERFGTIFNNHNALAFNSFISSSGLAEVPLGGCAFTWCHKSSSKMSKLDRFLISKDTWSNSSISDNNAISKLMKKLRHLKVDQELLNKRVNVMNSLHDLEKLEAMEIAQKVKINWSIEGDENSKIFHGMLNKKRNQHAIRGILSEGNWIEDPNSVKNEFLSHFKERFDSPCSLRLILDGEFPNKLSADQNLDLERNVPNKEIKRAVWDCGTYCDNPRISVY